jgi:hypothetical protein
VRLSDTHPSRSHPTNEDLFVGGPKKQRRGEGGAPGFHGLSSVTNFTNMYQDRELTLHR